jgi:hypothetical protein
MSAYLARQIKNGGLDYYIIFSSQFFKPYQAETDAILIADGFENLIVPIV